MPNGNVIEPAVALVVGRCAGRRVAGRLAPASPASSSFSPRPRPRRQAQNRSGVRRRRRGVAACNGSRFYQAAQRGRHARPPPSLTVQPRHRLPAGRMPS